MSKKRRKRKKSLKIITLFNSTELVEANIKRFAEIILTVLNEEKEGDKCSE